MGWAIWACGGIGFGSSTGTNRTRPGQLIFVPVRGVKSESQDNRDNFALVPPVSKKRLIPQKLMGLVQAGGTNRDNSDSSRLDPLSRDKKGVGQPGQQPYKGCPVVPPVPEGRCGRPASPSPPCTASPFGGAAQCWQSGTETLQCTHAGLNIFL
jgi:hypothetical protein